MFPKLLLVTTVAVALVSLTSAMPIEVSQTGADAVAAQEPAAPLVLKPVLRREAESKGPAESLRPVL